MNSPSSPLSPPFDKNLLSSHSQLGFSNNLSLSLKDFFMKQSGGDQVGLNLVPLGPFTGYSSILGSSKFLGPAQEVLEDICGGNCTSLEVSSMECLAGDEDVMSSSIGGFSGGNCKSSKLVLMLDEMYKRYKLYWQQVESVLVSFRSVAGLGNAAPYIGCAIKVVSKYFTCLKNALLDQIRSTVSDHKPSRLWRADHYSLRNADSAVTTRVLQNPVWRSQRGLPDQAVAVLKTWLFEHFLHPYPTDSEKQNLAQQTGLSRTQVSNWFINARVRLWKPMVEEVHMLESQQAQVHLQHQHCAVINHNSLAAAPKSNSSNFHDDDQLARETRWHQRHENQPNKRYRSELPGESNEVVSLALGLHHNNGLDSSWHIPMDMAQHVNLEMIRMMGSASAAANTTNDFKHPPNQHFGRDL